MPKVQSYLVRPYGVILYAVILTLHYLAGFGLGALNDADEDDLDVYDGSLNVRGGRRMAYDAEDDDDRITMGTSKSGRSRPSQPMRAPGITQTFRDGTPVLKGFILSDQPVAEDRW